MTWQSRLLLLSMFTVWVLSALVIARRLFF